MQNKSEDFIFIPEPPPIFATKSQSVKAEYQALKKTKFLALFVEVLTIFATQRQNYKFFLIQQSVIPTYLYKNRFMLILGVFSKGESISSTLLILLNEGSDLLAVVRISSGMAFRVSASRSSGMSG